MYCMWRVVCVVTCTTMYRLTISEESAQILWLRNGNVRCHLSHDDFDQRKGFEEETVQLSVQTWDSAPEIFACVRACWRGDDVFYHSCSLWQLKYVDLRRRFGQELLETKNFGKACYFVWNLQFCESGSQLLATVLCWYSMKGFMVWFMRNFCKSLFWLNTAHTKGYRWRKVSCID